MWQVLEKMPVLSDAMSIIWLLTCNFSYMQHSGVMGRNTFGANVAVDTRTRPISIATRSMSVARHLRLCVHCVRTRPNRKVTWLPTCIADTQGRVQANWVCDLHDNDLTAVQLIIYLYIDTNDVYIFYLSK